jgi:hypothetical protein
MKQIYIGECEHLENCCITDDACLKRYIHINNPKTGFVECLIFCNDYLKLKSQQEKYNNSLNNFCAKENVVKLIQNEIYKYLNINGNGRGWSSKNISSYIFGELVCDRPFTYIYIGINELITWYYENPNRHLLDTIRVRIVEFLDKLPSIASKNKYKQLIALSNKLSYQNTISNEEKEIILLELINETFKLTIKEN